MNENSILKIAIFTSFGKEYETEAISVLFPGKDGALYVLPDHIPLTCALKKGELIIEHNAKEKTVMTVYPGILELHKNKIKIISEKIELPD